MGQDSKIEWTDHTFNPWYGCTKVSPGCTNCYAEGWAKRSGLVQWGPLAPRRRSREHNWQQVRKWNADASGAARRPRVFCASLADWLDDSVPIEWFRDLLELIHTTPNLDWLLLSKRPQNWRTRIDAVLALGCPAGGDPSWWYLAQCWSCGVEPDNVWVGTTVEDQQRADERIPELIRIPARVRFLSCEPLLGPVDIEEHLEDMVDGGYVLGSAPIHWVICGGESGPKSRPMHPDWARSLRDQCVASGVSFFFKQWGEWHPAHDDGEVVVMEVTRLNSDGPKPAGHRNCPIHTFPDGQLAGRTGKASAGRMLDDQQWNELPKV